MAAKYHWNLFRIGGDLMHVASIFILLITLIGTRNCRGMSLKTQALYAVVFCSRYLDLFWNFNSMYNYVMKLLFISTSFAVIYLIKFKEPWRSTYDAKVDNFKVWLVVVPCAVLALLINDYFSVSEVLWTFSIYLEAVAIIPQMVAINQIAQQESGNVDSLTAHYVFTLGAYRALYLLNWFYRAMTEDGYRDWIVWGSGIVQTVVYADFFYYYIKARALGQKMSLPV